MDDFFTFLQLFVIFMISSGVAITAVLYPHYPLGVDLFTKAFVFRGLMALFSSEMADLKNQHQSCTINATSQTESEYACLRLSHGLSFKCKKMIYLFQIDSRIFFQMITFKHIIDMEFPHLNVIKHHG
jgi:hypothetical protein